MKNLILIASLSFMTTVFFSCKKPSAVNPNGSTAAKSDTSTTLISNIELVGNWNIVTDTVYSEGNGLVPGGSFMYRGTAVDHYIFTQYSNLYIKSAFHNYTDTAVYNISGIDSLNWINSYLSRAGSVIRGPSRVGAFIITSVTTHSLILTQSGWTPEGWGYEQITFKK